MWLVTVVTRTFTIIIRVFGTRREFYDRCREVKPEFSSTLELEFFPELLRT